jgi:hypothetical protein
MMGMKVTLQKDIVLARRWKYSPERKRSLPTNVYSVKRYQAPSELPSEVVEAHEVTAEEQQVYADFVTKLGKEMEVIHAEVGLRLLSNRLNDAKVALEDPELKETISLDGYEKLSETINEFKKLVTKNKNGLKRKLDRNGIFKLHNELKAIVKEGKAEACPTCKKYPVAESAFGDGCLYCNAKNKGEDVTTEELREQLSKYK